MKLYEIVHSSLFDSWFDMVVAKDEDEAAIKASIHTDYNMDIREIGTVYGTIDLDRVSRYYFEWAVWPPNAQIDADTFSATLTWATDVAEIIRQKEPGLDVWIEPAFSCDFEPILYFCIVGVDRDGVTTWLPSGIVLYS